MRDREISKAPLGSIGTKEHSEMFYVKIRNKERMRAFFFCYYHYESSIRGSTINFGPKIIYIQQCDIPRSFDAPNRAERTFFPSLWVHLFVSLERSYSASKQIINKASH